MTNLASRWYSRSTRKCRRYGFTERCGDTCKCHKRTPETTSATEAAKRLTPTSTPS